MLSEAKIKNGHLDHFIIFESFKSTSNERDFKKFQKNLEQLIKTRILIAGTIPNEDSIFMKQFDEELGRRFNIYVDSLNANKAIPNSIYGDFRKIKTAEIDIDNKNEKTNVYGLVDELYASQDTALEQLKVTYAQEQNHTGLSSTIKSRFLLMPVKVHFNGQQRFINVFLTMFNQGYCILQLSCKIIDYNIEELNKTVWNIPFDKVMLPEKIINNKDSLSYKKKARCNTLSDIATVYVNYLNGLFLYLDKSYTTTFNHLTLIDYDYRPKDYEVEMSVPLKENLFKLLYAPVTEITTQRKELINEFLKNHVYDFSKYHKSFANHSRVISLYSERIERPFKSICDVPISEKSFYFSSISGSLLSIEFLMFKKYSNVKHSIINLNSRMSLRALINHKVNENNDYVHQFSQFYFNFATVRSYSKFLETACEDFLQSELIQSQRARLEELIMLKKEKNNARFTAISALLAILITLIFSLPTLEDLLKILDKEQFLLFSYLTINSIFVIFIVVLFREPIKEIIVKLTYTILKFLKILFIKMKSSLIKIKKINSSIIFHNIKVEVLSIYKKVLKK